MQSGFFTKRISTLIVIIALSKLVLGQAEGCIFKDSLFSIDFGAGKYVQEFNLNALKNYKRDYSSCPNDGFYSYATKTSRCFNDDWITLTEDHTAGDLEGKMMIVNASERAGDFFLATLAGFKPGTDYEFSVWMLNVCKPNGGCSPLPPNILISLESRDGKKIAQFNTGQLRQQNQPIWQRYFGMFTTSNNVTTLTVRMTNTTNGGCGNDFAMDDLVVRECYPPDPPVVQPPPVEKVRTVSPVIIKPKPVVVPVPAKKDVRVINNLPVKDKVIAPGVILKQNFPVAAIPALLLSRENPVVKEISAVDGEILLELYDNGEIDGDTVSIYHNNKLLFSHQGLSATPISFKIKVNSEEVYHEIVMVADNLGSIPPNTSLMVITATGKRYEVFISSSEQKNAKIIIQKIK